MSQAISTYFRASSDYSKILSFGNSSDPGNFNYVRFNNNSLANAGLIEKHMVNSFKICIFNGSDSIEELKITNQDILSWEDYWISNDSRLLADPKIKKIDLRKNNLASVNINLSRPELRELNISGNNQLSSVLLKDIPNLTKLDISGCNGLSVINLGNNRSLEFLSAKNCNLNSVAQERLLRDFRPVITSDGNGNMLFKKEYKTLLDLRGNTVDWSNRKVASKIRLLLCNNWMVLWDNPPPTTVVPVQMYAFFTNNLEDNLIRSYYG